MTLTTKIMIAGIGGASLGTEICKSLQLAGGYEVYGCDISRTAYGLYDPGFVKTYHIDRDNYLAGVMSACADAGIKYLIAGGEQPMALLGEAAGTLLENGVQLVANSQEIVSIFSDKEETFSFLSGRGITTPLTVSVNDIEDISHVGLPCIVKPATGTGGSASVFFAVTVDEAMIYAEFIRRNGSVPLAQEYVDEGIGEFTIGVLSLPDKSVIGSIALKRALDAKLSVSYRGRGGVISSGYSQGHIDEYEDLCRQAEEIASAIGSQGPINIQGRVRDGVLLPFEINPRFSASTYLRAMAGFNEVDILLKYFLTGECPGEYSVKPGWYLRSLTEQYIPDAELR